MCRSVHTQHTLQYFNRGSLHSWPMQAQSPYKATAHCHNVVLLWQCAVNRTHSAQHNKAHTQLVSHYWLLLYTTHITVSG